MNHGFEITLSPITLQPNATREPATTTAPFTTAPFTTPPFTTPGGPAGNSHAARQLAKAVLDLSRGYALLAFRLVGAELHVLVACSEQRAERLGCRLCAHFAPPERRGQPTVFAWTEAVTTRQALQDAFYRLMKPALGASQHRDGEHEASNLPDLVGLRVNGDYTRLNVRSLLPDVHAPELFAFLDMPGISPPERFTIWEELPDAAAAAFAISDVHAPQPDARRARTAAVQTACRHLPVARVSQFMRLRRRTVRRLQRTQIDRDALRAVSMQLMLRRIRRTQEAMN
jgi:hypothetical protein